MTTLDTNKLGKVLALAGSDQDGEALVALLKAAHKLLVQEYGAYGPDEPETRIIRKLEAALSALAAAPGVPEGWKLVPVKPTREMRKAFHKADAQANSGMHRDSCAVGSPDWQWHAMLSASPAAPAAQTAPLRLVLMDVPGQPLALAVHDQAGERVAVAVKPMDALALAVDLTSSARRRLAGGAS